MTTLAWDQSGDRRFESGVDRGVLYLSDNTGVPWNGLTQVNETFNAGAAQPLYFEGVKYGEVLATSDFAGVLKAFTYPDEFLEYEGNKEPAPGFIFTGQAPRRFGLSWRTRVGNDVNAEAGYKIHILRNAAAIPAIRSNKTINDSPSMLEFEWQITTIPSRVPGFKPTSHLIFDSTRVDADILSAIEDILYGTISEDAHLPPFAELLYLADLV